MRIPLRKLAGTGAAAVVTIAGCVAACSSFADSTHPDVDTGDASVDAAAATDAGESPDGGREAAADGGSFCEGTNWVCDQFDHPPASWPKPQWDDPVATVTSGASVTITTEASISAPGAASAATPANAGTVSAQLRRAHLGAFRAFRCSFQVQLIDTGPGAMELFTVRVGVDGNQTFYTTGLLAGPSSGYFYENAETSPLLGLTAGVWHSVVVDVELGVGARLTIDNGVAVNPDAGSPSGMGSFTPTGAAITLGLAYSSNVTSAWRALYDDVRCDVH